jgi:hypothetical protein
MILYLRALQMVLPSRLVAGFFGWDLLLKGVTGMNSTRSHLFQLRFMSSTIYVEE